MIIGFVAEIFCKLRHGKVGVGVFERDRGRSVAFVDGHVAEFQVVGKEGALGAAMRSDAGLGSGLHHIFECGFEVEVVRSEGIGGCEQNGGRIAAHYIGDIVGCRPARQPAALTASLTSDCIMSLSRAGSKSACSCTVLR